MELTLDESEEWLGYVDDEEDISDEYWKAAQRPLATAVALTQQGIELLIKGRIADASPFLLISGTPRDWPKGCDQHDIPFSEFRTLDAQELVRAHDTVCGSRLPESFKQEYERLRQLRNTIFHTVDKTVRITAKEVLKAILETTEVLIGARRWVALRKQFIEESPDSVWAPSENVYIGINREIGRTVELFSPSEVLQFIGLNKKQRRYFCPECERECDNFSLKERDIRLAQLEPNTPYSKTVVCYACQSTFPVRRSPCTSEGCKGNVIDATEYDGQCLTCLDHLR